jgi:hypothetical protein
MSEQAAPRRISSPFRSLREWGEWMNAHTGPPRPDDTPVLTGQTGRRRRATSDQLMALVQEQRDKYARKRG